MAATFARLLCKNSHFYGWFQTFAVKCYTLYSHRLNDNDMILQLVKVKIEHFFLYAFDFSLALSSLCISCIDSGRFCIHSIPLHDFYLSVWTIFETTTKIERFHTQEKKTLHRDESQVEKRNRKKEQQSNCRTCINNIVRFTANTNTCTHRDRQTDKSQCTIPFWLHFSLYSTKSITIAEFSVC